MGEIRDEPLYNHHHGKIYQIFRNEFMISIYDNNYDKYPLNKI